MGKIWDEEYVDFGSLVSNPVHDKYQISLQNLEAGLPASLCLEPISKPETIHNIEAWQQAFSICVGVYTQKYPHEAPAHMKYGQPIRAARIGFPRFHRGFVLNSIAASFVLVNVIVTLGVLNATVNTAITRYTIARARIRARTRDRTRVRTRART